MAQTLRKRGEKRGGGRQQEVRERLVGTARRARGVVVRKPLEGLAILVALLVSAVFTGINMFSYPQYELDEGTYVGSAWAMFERGALYYYTYTYDHTPLGWFQVGLLSEFVGGFPRFGTTINTGRFFMLVATLLSTLMVYLIVRHASKRI